LPKAAIEVAWVYATDLACEEPLFRISCPQQNQHTEGTDPAAVTLPAFRATLISGAGSDVAEQTRRHKTKLDLLFTMSYTLHDAMLDEGYEAMYRELYPEHRAQAIEEFTSERLQSYYLQNPDVAVKGALSFKEASALLEHGHASACVVFAATSVEQFLKAALLRPVVFGLIHVESLATLIVDIVTDQNGGMERYKKLLSGLFKHLADIELTSVRREGAPKPLLEEIAALQKLRNAIVHRGEQATAPDGEQALAVANAVYSQVFVRLLAALGLRTIKGVRIVAE